MPACTQEAVLEPTSSVLPIHIRRFQPGDEACFLRLNEEWIVKYFVLEEKDRAVLGDPVKYIMNPGGEIIFATVGDETVGCCALVPTAPGEYEVAKMAVTETCRGRGIGRLILEAIICEGRRLGASRLYLETNSGLPNATHLYEALGFQHIPVERRKPSLYSRADVFMEMLLD
jgi:putative acetyltransferase